MNDSKIEWTDITWNPVTGCSKVSQGCKHCYAERIFPRPYPGLAFTDVRTHPDRLDAPLKMRAPKRIFVNSMSDLFHEDVPDEFIDDVFMCMVAAHWHTFQVLTKRPERMLRWVRDFYQEAPPGNVWLGVSVEDQTTADARIPLLLKTPSAVRFLSCEPLLGPITLTAEGRIPADEDGPNRIGYMVGADDGHSGLMPTPALALARSGLHWVIVGGESGPHARPTHPDWVRSLRDQCAAARVSFFFKQWGNRLPGELTDGDPILRWQTGASQYMNDHLDIKLDEWCLGRSGNKLVFSVREPKKKAGRLLDGRTWDEVPG